MTFAISVDIVSLLGDDHISIVNMSSTSAFHQGSADPDFANQGSLGKSFLWKVLFVLLYFDPDVNCVFMFVAADNSPVISSRGRFKDSTRYTGGPFTECFQSRAVKLNTVVEPYG